MNTLRRLPFRGRHSLFAATLAAIVLLGCGGPDHDHLLESAKSYLLKGDSKAAVIQVKTALQKKESPQARFLLGQALFQSGELVTAAVELRKALDLRYPAAEVIPLLARVMLLQGSHKAVIADFGSVDLDDAAAMADLKTSVAAAYARQGEVKASDAALAVALLAVPEYAPALTLKARLAAVKGDFDGALQIVDGVVARSPKEYEAWMLKAEVLARIKRDRVAAASAYRKALESRNDLVAAHDGLVALALSANDIDEAGQQVAEMKKVLPRHPRTILLEAKLGVAQQEYKKAKELIDQVVKVASEDPEVLFVAGVVEYQLRSLAQAESHLQKALRFAPGFRPARLVLAQTQLQAAQPSKALSTLQPLLVKESTDAGAIALAGEAHLRKGELGAAEVLFMRASKLDPGNPKSRTALALTRLRKGEVDAAFGELEAVASTDSGTTADLALISAQLRQRRFDAAMKAIERLEHKQADQAVGPYLRGLAQLGRKQYDDARQSFERALRIDPAYFGAAVQLAQLDLRDKKPDAARGRFEQVLKVRPSSTDALLALAHLKAAGGGTRDEVTTLLTNAIRLDPAAPGPRLTLIAHHLSGGKADLALAAAQDAVAQSPNNPRLLDALGRTQAAAGDVQQAIATLGKVVALLPESAIPLLRLADVHSSARNNEAAIQHLKRALELKPNLLQAQERLSIVARAAGRYDEALAIAKTVQKQRPKSAVGFVLEGDLEGSRNNWVAAIAAYRGSLNLEGGSLSAIRLHGALLNSGKLDEAERFGLAWIKEHPRDIAFLLYRGEALLVRGDEANAETFYAKVLELHPLNVTALNNMAWLLSKQKKAGALVYAERANDAKPNQPILLDTLAQILAQEGNVDRALEVRRKAVDLAPANDFLRLSLARLYIDAGKKAEAKVELQRLAAAGDRFAKQSEVQVLLKKL